MLGAPTLTWHSAPLPIRRTAAVQALVYLAAHPGGVTSHDLATGLWPGERTHTATARLYTTLSDLRRVLRYTTGQPVLRHHGDRYDLDPEQVDVDLWRLTDAAHAAATSLTEQDRSRAARTVIDLYGGVLAEGHTWPWLQAPRERARRHAIDAHVMLADTAPPAERLALLQTAVRLDDLNEDLHHRAADAMTQAGDPDGAAALLAAYTRRLTAAGLHP